MENLTVFKNEELGLEVRCTIIDGKEYFVANDIAKALGYSSPKDAITRHCKGATKRTLGVVTGKKKDGNDSIQNINMKMIPEGDMYRLIVRSKLPSAEKFEVWVMDEVLPQIRKTGGYIPVKEEDSDVEILARAFEIQQRTIAKKDEIIASKNKIIEEKSQDSAVVKMLVEKDGCVTLKQFADTLDIKGLGRNTVYAILRDMGFIVKNSTQPYRRWIDQGILKSRYTLINGDITYVTMVTPKGEEYLTKRILKFIDTDTNKLSDKCIEFAKEVVLYDGKSEEEFIAMTLKPNQFREEWLGVKELAETIYDEEDEDASELLDIILEIDELIN